ncbi:MAG: hypothetical protein LBB38_00695 [Puniceicoccales bacterium]|jgi:hypothetical protein|nr:hypothetical protein [Puniceicoccales bacterium]
MYTMTAIQPRSAATDFTIARGSIHGAADDYLYRCREPLISFNRNDEIAAIAASKRICGKESSINIQKTPLEIYYGAMEGNLPIFASSFVVVGGKHSGVEGGFMIRLIWPNRDLEKFPIDCPHGFRQLQKLSRENSDLIPQLLWSSNLGGRGVLDIFAELPPSEQIAIGRMCMDLTPEFRKTFLVKVVFGEENVSGTRHYKGNPKNVLHKLWTVRNQKEINRDVLREFAALQIAARINKGIAVESHLGFIGGCRWCLITAMCASGIENAEYETLARCPEEKLIATKKETLAQAYAISVGLFGDRDANGGANVAVLSVKGQPAQLQYFDFGHMEPNKYPLDPKTLLPDVGPTAFTKFHLGCLTSVDEDMRARALIDLYERWDDVIATIQDLSKTLEHDREAVHTFEVMADEFNERFRHIGGVLPMWLRLRQRQIKPDDPTDGGHLPLIIA